MSAGAAACPVCKAPTSAWSLVAGFPRPRFPCSNCGALLSFERPFPPGRDGPLFLALMAIALSGGLALVRPIESVLARALALAVVALALWHGLKRLLALWAHFASKPALVRSDDPERA